MRLTSVWISIVFFLAACVEPGPDQKLTLPAGLTTDVLYGEEGSGTIDLIASASLTNFYTADFGDGSAEVVSKNGDFSHRYRASGDYTIVVRAHVTTDLFIEAETLVTISINEVYIPTAGTTSPLTYAGKTLVWQDEFDGPDLDPTKWTFDLGTGNNGWGNNELQYYRSENAKIQEGHLVITARKEPFQGKTYTSSRLKTAGLQSFQYGRIDVRAVIPEGQGVWSAAWMLGNNIGTVGWPRCGEIDIMEVVGGQGREKTVLGTAHWDNNGSYASFGSTRSLSSGTLNEQFHVYSVEWDEQSIRWYIDDVQYHALDIAPAELSEFRQSFYLILNLAIGGTLPGNPDSSTLFPRHLIVDYVRYFQ